MRGSLATHRQTQHSVAIGGAGQKYNEGGRSRDTRTFWMTFLEKVVPSPCPFEVCSVWAVTRTAMLVNFWYRHVRDTVVILEEGNLPHPR